MSRIRQILRRREGRRDPEVVEVGQARFRFLGFSAPAGPTLLGRFDYRPAGLPPMPELRDAVFLPDHRCLYTPAGLRLEVSRPVYMEPDAPAWFNAPKVEALERESMAQEIAPATAEERVAEPVLFLGEIHDHWGHFITDTLARFWALDQFGPDTKVLFAPDPARRIDTPLVQALLNAAGVTPGRILRPQAPTLFARLHCPLPALQLSRIYQGFEEVHRRIAAAVLDGSGPQPPSGPVYLTRSRLGEQLRRLEGEERLEERLAREGYAIVSPERLTLAEQMAIFEGGRPVVGAFGSAMHTVLFRRPEAPPVVATLFPQKIPPRFMMVDIVKRAEASYLNCIRNEAPGQNRWSVNVDAALERLDAAGLLQRG